MALFLKTRIHNVAMLVRDGFGSRIFVVLNIDRVGGLVVGRRHDVVVPKVINDMLGRM